MSRSFPAGFEWGSATAAHQIEGGNWNNDWWQWEHTAGSACTEPSGDACDSWNRWPDDVALAGELGLTSYRFSIEWSRIEPEEGEWSAAAFDHYLALGRALLDAGIDPVVTFHHFTSPRWFAARGYCAGTTQPAPHAFAVPSKIGKSKNGSLKLNRTVLSSTASTPAVFSRSTSPQAPR